MQAYHFPTLCFNFSLNPPVASQHPPLCFATSPLTKGGKPPQITTHHSSSLRRPKACGNPQTTIFLFIHRKEKEFTIIYQIKELIFNEILIFNFQFSIFFSTPLLLRNILLRNIPPYKGRQTPTNHYSPLFVIAKAKGLWQSINHYFFIHSQKRKKKSLLFNKPKN